MEDTKIKVFLTVAEEKSFTMASRRLGISQPAVSQNIADLEKALGCPLFERQRGTVRPTPQGEAFLRHARTIASDYERITSIFDAGALRPDSPVRILTTPFIKENYLPSILGEIAVLSGADFLIETVRDEDIHPGDTGADLLFYPEYFRSGPGTFTMTVRHRASESFAGTALYKTIVKYYLEQ